MINPHDLFYYDESSPSGLRWKIGRGNRSADSVAGCLVTDKRNGRKVYRVNFLGRLVMNHRIVYELTNECILLTEDEIDHIDGNSLNNFKENLRKVNRELNTRNAKIRKDNKTGITGVQYSSRMLAYRAKICVDGKIFTKSFSINKYGEDLAFLLACEYREKMLNSLNEHGAGYTERHGT